VTHALWPYLVFCVALMFMHVAVSHTLNKIQHPANRDYLKVRWFHKMWTQVPEPYCSQVLTVTKNMWGLFNACLQLSHSGLFTSPSFCRYAFKWQCSCNSPIIVAGFYSSWVILQLFSTMSFKKAHHLLLSMNGWPILLMFPVCSVPGHLPGNPTSGYFARSKTAGMWKMTTHSHLVPKLTMPKAVPPVLQVPSWWAQWQLTVTSSISVGSYPLWIKWTQNKLTN
jgi:hypothetical protein